MMGWTESLLAGQSPESALRLRNLNSLTPTDKLAFERRCRHGPGAGDAEPEQRTAAFRVLILDTTAFPLSWRLWHIHPTLLL